MVKHVTESLLKQYNVIACIFVFYHFKHQLTSFINLDMMEISLIFQSETQIVKKKKKKKATVQTTGNRSKPASFALDRYHSLTTEAAALYYT